MKVLISPDSFKGSLSAKAAAEAIAVGVRKASADAEVEILPIADGGEGTMECLLSVVGGEKVTVSVHDPLGRTIDAHYAVLPDGTVVIEVAQAVGLGLVDSTLPDVPDRNTFGVGQLLAHALNAGWTSFVIGLGGSATNDGGIGMLSALGAQFFNSDGNELQPTPASCLSVAHIDVSGLHKGIRNATFRIASDVQNPLCGPSGATAVYGPQKGVTAEQIPVLDKMLHLFASVLETDIGISVENKPGAGAAGGLGAAFIGLLDAKMVRGIDLILDLCHFEEHLSEADLVLTGEGRTDSQTAQGKAVCGISGRAKDHHVPVVCLSGSVADDASTLHEVGLTAMFSITTGPATLEDAMQSTAENLERTAEQVVRLFLAR